MTLISRKKLRILIGTLALGIVIVFSAIFFGDKFNEEVKSVSQLGRGEVLKLTPSVSSEYSKFNLRMQFSYDGRGKFPNLFQTDDSNSGLRFELDSHKAGFVISDSSKVEGYRIFPLSAPIEFGRWYNLEIKVVNHEYFEAYLDGKRVVDFKAKNIVIGNRNFMVGQGFNSDRLFSGEIRNVESEFYTPNKIAVLYEQIKLNLPFPFLANYIFLIGFLVFFSFKGFSEINLKKIPTSKALAPFLMLMHAYLLLKVPEYRTTFIVYFFLFLAGISHYSLVFPPSWRGRSFDYLFIPINGLILITIIGGIFVASSIRITFLPWVITLVALSSLALLFVYKKNTVVQQFRILKHNIKDFFIFHSLIVVPITLVILYPVLFNDYQTSPVRMGPDLVSYANMSQYLLDGGTWDLSRGRALEFQGMNPSEIVAYSDATMSWPFMFYFRWGLSAFQSVVSLITFSTHAYQTSFVSILLPYLFLAGVILFYLKEKLGMSWFVSSLGFLALLFNANLINLWFEGFHANVFSLVFLTLALIVICEIRVLKLSNGGIQDNLLLLILLIIVLLFSYPEVIFFVLLPLLAVSLLMEILVFRRSDFYTYWIPIACILLGILFVLPFGFLRDWLNLTYAQIVNSGGNGYAQPTWALPNEILGFNNLYLPLRIVDAGHLIGRSPKKIIFCLVTSLLIAFSIYKFFKDVQNKNKDLLLAIILLISVSWYFAYSKNQENNYSYMKMYVTLLPIALIYFWDSLNNLFNLYLKRYSLSRSVFFLSISIPIVCNGLSYVYQYQKDTDFIPEPLISSHQKFHEFSSDKAVIYSNQLRENRTFYSAIFPEPWFFKDVWEHSAAKKMLFRNFATHKVFLFVEKQNNKNYSSPKSRVLFENNFYLIIDSGLNVTDVVKRDTNINEKDYFSSYE